MGTNNHSNHQSGHSQSHHFILPVRTAVTIGVLLLILTGITVGIARVDLGRLNFTIAMVVATVKALLVGMFFMGLLYDRRENAMIFLTSFVFLGIFIVLTGTDMFFRGDVYVKGPLNVASQSKSKIAKPWISTPELVAHGKELFKQQCASCHGEAGKGDGPAAAALTPHPRNFTQTEGWKNGRKVTMIFKTLKEGIAGSAMASYASLPADDRWSLAHYVASLGPTPPEADTPADFAKIDVDPTKEAVVEKEAPKIPISFAMQRYAVAESEAKVRAQHLYHRGLEAPRPSEEGSVASQIYRDSCVQCHGDHGEGGIKVKAIGVNPITFVTTRSFKESEGMKSLEAFTHAVVHGIPGNLMPGMGQLSSGEIRELYQFILQGL